MQNCASDPIYFYNANVASELATASSRSARRSWLSA